MGLLFVTSNVLSHGVCYNGKVEKVLVMLEDMEKSGMVGDIVTYNIIIIIIRGMCKAGEVADAWGFYCSLSLKGPVPDIWTYTTMMLGLYKKRLNHLR